MSFSGKFAVVSVISLTAAVLAGMFFHAAPARGSEAPVGQVDLERIYREYRGMMKFQSDMRELQVKLQEAQEAGDEEKLVELYSEARGRQEEFHREFESSLEAAARTAAAETGVRMVVIHVLYKPDTEEVKDVSGEIIAAMNR